MEYQELLEKIKIQRLRRKIRQKDLARKMGIHYSTYSLKELGINRFNIGEFCILLRELFTEEEILEIIQNLGVKK